MMNLKQVGSAIALAAQVTLVSAFQLAPLGSEFEAKLTNESPNWLSSVAGKVGVLIKEPVHEEITQLGYGCPVELGQLRGDTSCKGADRGFASPYVIYGVRWNDLPPFRLQPNEGKSCKKFLTGAAACNVEQTVRFATQPECWYCMFTSAQKTAETRKISGCARGKGYTQGNLLTRSHFGDLQFLHGMASEDDVQAPVTRQKMIDWVEFAWKVSAREIKPETMLKTIANPTIAEHFGCSDWTVADIYILGRNNHLLPKLNHIAFGSVLHTIQDSFAGGHTTREAVASMGTCSGTDIPKPPRIVEFHSYGGQDGHKHDARDERTALLGADESRWPDAVDATRRLFELKDAHASWDTAKPYVECILELAPNHRPSSSGEEFRRASK